MRAALWLCVALCAVASVVGHARLTATNGGGGIAWQPNPSNNGQCGNTGSSTPPTTIPYDKWTAGQTVNLFWQVIAGDGEGPITVTIDSAGTSTPNAFSGGTAVTPITQDGETTIAYHAISFTVPTGFACTGTTTTNGNMCVVQFKGANNWVSCIYISSDAAANTANTPGQALCATASGLPFCSWVSGSVFLNPVGTTVLNMDASAQTIYNSYINNKNVFSNNGNAATKTLCTAAFKDLVCELTFGKCNSNTVATGNVVAPCHQTCRAATCYCGLNATHLDLYDCDNYNIYGSPNNIGNAGCTRESDPLPNLNGAAAVSAATCASGVNNPPGNTLNPPGGCASPPCAGTALRASMLAVLFAIVFAVLSRSSTL